MTPLATLSASLFVFWSLIYLLKLIFPRLFAGVSLQVCQLKYATTRFNYFFHRIGSKYSQFWLVWFNLGYWSGLVGMIIGWLGLWVVSWKLLVTLVKKLSNHFFMTFIASYSNAQNGDDAVVMPLIPGVTLPLSHLPQLFLALFVAGIWHEMGHGIAGGRERVPILSTGFFFALIYPGAYVELDQSSLNNLLSKSQLRIILAGIWHNLTLSLVGYLILFIKLDTFIFKNTFWKTPSRDGIGVVSVQHDSSGLFDDLPRFSSIIKVNNRSTHWYDMQTWSKALLTPSKSQTPANSTNGYCVRLDDLTNSSESCCLPPYPPMSSPSACFYSLDPQYPLLKGCLPVRTLIDPTVTTCVKQSECVQHEEICSLVGYYPTDHPHHLTQLTILSPDSDETSSLLHVGSPRQVYDRVEVAQLLPRWSWVPSSIPTWTQRLFAYLTSLSVGLFFLNALPAFQLDGYHALMVLIRDQFFKRHSHHLEVSNLPYLHQIVGITNLLLVWCMIVSTLCILI